MSDTKTDEHFLTLYQSVLSKPNIESCLGHSDLFVINKINFCDGLLDPAHSFMIVISAS